MSIIKTGRSLHQIHSEIYSIMKYKDITVFWKVLRDHFPKSKGSIGRLNTDELEKLIPILREAYKCSGIIKKRQSN